MSSGGHPLDIGTVIIGVAVGGADGSAGGIAGAASVAGVEFQRPDTWPHRSSRDFSKTLCPASPPGIFLRLKSLAELIGIWYPIGYHFGRLESRQARRAGLTKAEPYLE
jgi:hypothetical protein